MDTPERCATLFAEILKLAKGMSSDRVAAKEILRFAQSGVELCASPVTDPRTAAGKPSTRHRTSGGAASGGHGSTSAGDPELASSPGKPSQERSER